MNKTTPAARAKAFNAMLKDLRSMGIKLRRRIIRLTGHGDMTQYAHYVFAGGVEKRDRTVANEKVLAEREARAYSARWDVWQLDVSYHNTDKAALDYVVKHADAIGAQGWDPELIVGRGPGGVAVLLVYANEVDGAFIDVEDRRRGAKPGRRS